MGSWSLTGFLNFDGCAWCNRSELLHIALGLAPDIGPGREADFIAAGYGRATETDRDGIAFHPESELAGQNDIPGGVLQFHFDRSGEIHFLTPGIRPGGERQGIPDCIRRGRLEEFGLEHHGTDGHLDLSHKYRLWSLHTPRAARQKAARSRHV